MASRNSSISPRARLGAAMIALIGLAGLAIQTVVSTGTSGSLPAALWAMLRFFTIISNLLTLVLFAAIALGVQAAFAPRRLAGIAVIMGLVGVVYVTLLAKTEHLVGAAQTANLIMHYVIPPLVALYWLAFAPKARLSWGDPVRWALLPVAYLPYALLRAALDGRYAYPFLDVGKLGWMQVCLNALGIAIGFLVAGLILVGLDGLLGRKDRAP